MLLTGSAHETEPNEWAEERWVGESSGIEVDRRFARMAQLDPLCSKPVGLGGVG